MKDKKVLWILIAAFVLLLIGAGALYKGLGDMVQLGGLATMGTTAPEETTLPDESIPPSATNTEETTEVPSQKAPDFTVYDEEGNAYKLSDFVGKPVIVNFWASWCGPCKMEMPDFDEMYQLRGEDIHFLMVNMTDNSRETVEVAKDFIKEAGYSFPVYFDTEYSAAIAYGVSSIPATYFIDAEGNAIAYATGAINAETLQTGIDMILPE